MPRPRQLSRDGYHAVLAEAWVDLTEPRKAADHQSCADEQHPSAEQFQLSGLAHLGTPDVAVVPAPLFGGQAFGASPLRPSLFPLGESTFERRDVVVPHGGHG